MKTLTKEGDGKIEDIAARYSLSKDSVLSLLEAIVNGNAMMAQFNVPELGGSGQWMKGGMTMVGDMFNRSLKITVDQLCTELANLVSTEIIFDVSDSKPKKDTTEADKPWPAVFGKPTTSGSQNNFRYAYFAPVRRLVIESNGNRAIYDTKHHEVFSVSQQQGAQQSFVITGQDGPIELSSLPLTSEPETLPQSTSEHPHDMVSSSRLKEAEPTSSEDVILATIEKLSVLLEKGHITEEEFKAKKAELLGRL
ncbi:SHOCT domain-containing protein [Dyadobacter sp. LHD-138]|uniref:SHOCT domain-containing protein n=1 Tax=Dyadobacter sp. LHD-138 TaxID=3071413 RepID=UPI0027E0A3CB|nr:SHOCT domain-containing protein [Dyadobacter sp. LHD-138]MDQ6480855.1 SHOCT domain-containing protein [Dyadobacter sp. LHD-138]